MVAESGYLGGSFRGTCHMCGFGDETRRVVERLLDVCDQHARRDEDECVHTLEVKNGAIRRVCEAREARRGVNL